MEIEYMKDKRVAPIKFLVIDRNWKYVLCEPRNGIKFDPRKEFKAYHGHKPDKPMLFVIPSAVTSVDPSFTYTISDKAQDFGWIAVQL